jgi:hypothetical protein
VSRSFDCRSERKTSTGDTDLFCTGQPEILQFFSFLDKIWGKKSALCESCFKSELVLYSNADDEQK